MALPLPLADVVEITAVLTLYGHLVDNAAVDALDRVFTDDASFLPSAPGMAPIEGLPAIKAMMAAVPGMNHNTLTPSITVDGEGTVRALSRYLQFRPDGSMVNGEYLDEVVPTAAGWRIRSRRALRRVPAPEGGLARDDYGPWWPGA